MDNEFLNKENIEMLWEIIIDENLYDPKKYESIVKSVNFIVK